jgi:hypothetical protein
MSAYARLGSDREIPSGTLSNSETKHVWKVMMDLAQQQNIQPMIQGPCLDIEQ